MWPNGVGASSVSLALAGIDDIHLIYISVAIPVIVGKVDDIVHTFACFYNHFSRPQVIVSIVVCTIVGLVVFKLYWTYNVEIEDEVAVALGSKIVAYATFEIPLRVAFFVSNVVECSLWICCGEFYVCIFDKDDDTLLRTVIAPVVIGFPHLCLAARDSFRPSGVGIGYEGLHVSNMISARLVSNVFVSSGILHVVQMFIATKFSFDLCTIGKRYHAPLSSFGWNSRCHNCHEKQSYHHHISLHKCIHIH